MTKMFPPPPEKPAPEVESPIPKAPVPAQVPAAGADPSASGEPAAVQKLTPEEQMALFEKELKENDWGHQPC